MKKLCKFAIFIVLLGIIVLLVDAKLRPDGGAVSAFRNTYCNADVLFYGSSHEFCNINAGTLWNERGIAACSLGQPEQPISMTYYQMKNSFEYDIPKLAVVEMYMAGLGMDDFDKLKKESHYSYALLTYPIYKDFKERVEASQFLEADKISFILGLPTYHSNYNNGEKNAADVRAGFQYRYDINEDGQLDSRYSTEEISVEEATPLPEETEEYLGRIKELCNEKGIQLLLLVTPYQMEYKHMLYLKSVEKWAEENNVDFVDMNNIVDEIGIDLDTQMYDCGHARLDGNIKNSEWLAEYLAEHYHIPDHSGEDGYEAWDRVYSFMCWEAENNLHGEAY